MKKNIVALLFLSLGILLACSLAMAANPYTAGTGVQGSPHDLSRAGNGLAWDAPTAAEEPLDRICIYCHAPHHTMTPAEALTLGITYYPLWNHNVTPHADYQLYQNNTGGDIPNQIPKQLNAALTQPGSISKLCLSCHDGSVAISSYGQLGGGVSSSQHVGTAFASGRIGIGTSPNSLMNHHPIGFDYTAVAVNPDDGIKDASSSLLGANSFSLTINDLLIAGKMECSSCHDVHNKRVEPLSTQLTIVRDVQSNLCFTCHDK